MNKRFWNKVNRTSSCWFWQGGKTGAGYGGYWSNGRTIGSHRAIYEFLNGAPGEGKVLHICDNRHCVNPEHLFLGTSKQNSEDMVKKEQQSRGEDRPLAKLSETNIPNIRNSKESNSVLAKQYAVSRTTIQDARSGKTWKHI